MESTFNFAGNNKTHLDHLCARYFYQIKFGLCWQIFIKVLNTIVHGNPSSRSRADAYMGTDGRTDVLKDRDKQTDVTQVIGTLQDYENAPKDWNVYFDISGHIIHGYFEQTKLLRKSEEVIFVLKEQRCINNLINSECYSSFSVFHTVL